MMASVFIEPHERYEAIEAYRDKLSAEQIEQIKDAPDGALVNLQWGIGTAETKLLIIEEG